MSETAEHLVKRKGEMALCCGCGVRFATKLVGEKPACEDQACADRIRLVSKSNEQQYVTC